MADVGSPAWTLVIPVKPLGTAKTRLRGALPGVPHERLVLALAVALGARVLPDEPRAGLNAALAFGAAYAYQENNWIAALAADLPALRTADLTAALMAAAAEPGRSYVPDADGTGTTLLAAASGAELDPRFGPGSAAAHAGSGARPLAGDWPSLRRDVDTGADLAHAARLGLGPRTASLLPSLSRVAGMQGTVASYDAATRSGTLLLDDGTEIAFPATAFDASGLRLLRVGQRLRIEHDESGQVARVTLPTFS
jgi:2-phospho-L-lactate guanylyltransferase